MRNFALSLALIAANTFAQNCINYGATTTLTGTLVLVDEAGYNQYDALRLSTSICTVSDPKDVTDKSDPNYRKQTGLREFQAAVYGDDAEANALRDRLHTLIGHRAIIKGSLAPAVTGYDRTSVMLRVEAVDPTDPAGRQALLRPEVRVAVKNVPAYEATINTGKRLVVKVYESASKAPLVPPEAYITHWMTGGEVVYFNCRDGYVIGNAERDGDPCDPELFMCGLPAFPKKTEVLKLRCTKIP